MTESGGNQPEVVYITKWDSVDEMQSKRKEMKSSCDIRKLWETVMPLMITSQNYLCIKDDKFEGSRPEPSSRILLEQFHWVGSKIDALEALRNRLHMYADKYPNLVKVIGILCPITFSKPGFFVLTEVKDGDLNKMVSLSKDLMENDDVKQQLADDAKHISVASVRLLCPIQQICTK